MMRIKIFLVVSTFLFIELLCLAGCGGGNSSPSTPLRELKVDTNTVALWHFNENTGTTAQDSSSNHRDLSFSSAPSDPIWVNSEHSGFGSCLSLNRSESDNASWTTGDQVTSFSGNQFSIESWINLNELPSGSGATSVFDCETFWLAIDMSGRILLSIYDVTGGVIRIITTDGSDTSSDKTKINTGSWYYIVATYSPTDKAKIYINGVLQQTTGDTTFPDISGPYEFSFTNSLYLGKHCITGMIDEVRISNIARSAATISNYYTQATQ